MFIPSTVSACYAVLLSALLAAAGSPPMRAFDHLLEKRQSNSLGLPLVDLGYARYMGVANSTTSINYWRGIRFAAPPTGNLRWQAPVVPAINRSSVIPATSYASRCFQSAASSFSHSPLGQGSEDCLFLNVYAPMNATNLPVMVWIHGGGYGQGNGAVDLSGLINDNNNSFIGVAIQYRLGALGFLAGDEVARRGSLNNGLRDQNFALQWIQTYIGLFGGNRSAVTITGESGGGGSVLFQTISYGGSLGTQLFQNAIAASPSQHANYPYWGYIPSQAYYAFAQAAGCGATTSVNGTGGSVFSCLVAQDAMIVAAASNNISQSGVYGNWGFDPTIDGVFIEEAPSQALLKRKVNGVRLLAGNNVAEGPPFTPYNITTEADLVNWIQDLLPNFTPNDVSKVLLYYPGLNTSTNPSDPLFPTLGNLGPTVINQSSVATGQQQRANIIRGELTYVCPCYWLTQAFTDNGKLAYKYQYSVGASLHGSDVAAYIGPNAATQGPDFVKAFRNIWGNFITQNDPSISNAIANGASSSDPSAANPASAWPPFTLYAPYQLNLNETGGVPFATAEYGVNVTQNQGPGLRNMFELVNAWTWEGGRGQRCDFWRSMAALDPL